MNIIKTLCMTILIFSLPTVAADKDTIWDGFIDNDEYFEYFYDERFSIVEKLYRDYGVVVIPDFSTVDISLISYVACMENDTGHYFESVEDSLSYLKDYHDIIKSNLGDSCKGCSTVDEFFDFSEKYKKLFWKYTQLKDGKVSFLGEGKLASAHDAIKKLTEHFVEVQKVGRVTTTRNWLKQNYQRVKVLTDAYLYKDGAEYEKKIEFSFRNNLANYFNYAYKGTSRFDEANIELFTEYKVNEGPTFDNAKQIDVDNALERILRMSRESNRCIKLRKNTPRSEKNDPSYCLNQEYKDVRVPSGWRVTYFADHKRYTDLKKAGFQSITPEKSIVSKIKAEYKSLSADIETPNSYNYTYLDFGMGSLWSDMSRFDDKGRLIFYTTLFTDPPKDFATIPRIKHPIHPQAIQIAFNPNYEYESNQQTYLEYNEFNEVIRLIDTRRVWLEEQEKFKTSSGLDELIGLSNKKGTKAFRDLSFENGLLNGVSYYYDPFYRNDVSYIAPAPGLGIKRNYIKIFDMEGYREDDFDEVLMVNFVDGIVEGEVKIIAKSKRINYMQVLIFKDGILDWDSLLASKVEVME